MRGNPRMGVGDTPQERRRSRGVCANCVTPAKAGHTQCERCRKRGLERSHLRAEARKAVGRCGQCGADRDPTSKSSCTECLRVRKERLRDHYRVRAADGMCRSCGKRRPSTPRLKTCEKCRVRARKRAADRRQQVLDHYGRACACCKERTELFLTIDHINNDGAAHRRSVDIGHFYGWLRSNGFPEGFQTLCYNCNIGKYRNGGSCPHLRMVA